MTTLHRLHVFVSVAEHGSVTKASRELHVTQPAVSQGLRLLEQNLGYTLIKRNRRGIELTDDGVALRAKAKSILSLVNALKRKNVSVHPEPSYEVLTLGASHGMSTALMPFLMARFKETHPAVNLSLYTNTNREIESLLLRSKLDIGIATNPKRFAALHMEPFQAAKLCALVPVNHSLANAKEITLRELGEMRLVVRAGKDGASQTELLLGKMRNLGLKPDIAFRCGSPDAVKSAVRNGTGVGVLIDDAVQDRVSRNDFGILKIKGFDLTARTYILYSKKKRLSKTAEAFLAVLRTWRMNNRMD